MYSETRKSARNSSELPFFSVLTRHSDEVLALLRVDSRIVGLTEVRPLSQQAWDQRFSVDLDRSKELEIEVFYRDSRSMCAFTAVKLANFVEPTGQAGMVLHLEPHGDLFAEVVFFASNLVVHLTQLFPVQVPESSLFAALGNLRWFRFQERKDMAGAKKQLGVHALSRMLKGRENEPIVDYGSAAAQSVHGMSSKSCSVAVRELVKERPGSYVDVSNRPSQTSPLSLGGERSATSLYRHQHSQKESTVLIHNLRTMSISSTVPGETNEEVVSLSSPVRS
ncbi:hypothetical protein NECAME_14756 [Necator americanus]|uniref:C2 domain-containing protein n=1 Tax=Necator americanus TaxID=51031 RepID=W2SP16_NECAM|nr:hypothetical protein NECAME_14756 [Necator americanus]ETN70447.1 hypothetical protein NECAME_14756 [Necator americanus]